jgi:hypothetical protein
MIRLIKTFVTLPSLMNISDCHSLPGAKPLSVTRVHNRSTDAQLCPRAYEHNCLVRSAHRVHTRGSIRATVRECDNMLQCLT